MRARRTDAKEEELLTAARYVMLLLLLHCCCFVCLVKMAFRPTEKKSRVRVRSMHIQKRLPVNAAELSISSSRFFFIIANGYKK